MSIAKNALLKKFALDERKVHLKSIDADVVLRNFTSEENDEFAKYAIKSMDADGNPEVDLSKSMELKYMKVSAALVEPELTVDDLKGMYGAKDFITEVLKELGEADPEKVDEEGNES